MQFGIRQTLWRIDPGLLALRQACRTVIAVTLCVLTLISFSLSPILIVYAGLAAGFIIQNVYGQTQSARAISLLFAGVSFILTIFLASLVKGNIIQTDILLIVLAYFAFYLRRFGERFALFPVNAWVLALMCSVLPSDGGNGLIENTVVTLIGVLVGAIVYLFIFPVRRQYLFFDNLHNFTAFIAKHLRYLASIETHSIDDNSFYEKIKMRQQTQRKLYLANLEIMQTFSRSSSKDFQQYEEILNLQYMLGKSTLVLNEHVGLLVKSNTRLPYSVRRQLAKGLLKCSHLSLGSQSENGNYDELILQKYLEETDIQDPELIMPVHGIMMALSNIAQYIETLHNKLENNKLEKTGSL